MGNFYVNYTVRGSTQKAVAAALAGRNAKVTSAVKGCVVVFDQQSDEQDQDVIAELASRLSKELGCVVLAVLNHDDDILWYQLHAKGRLTDQYDSSPGYFDPEAEPSAPKGGNAAILCAAFSASRVAEVERILRKSSYDDDGYTFALERHADLVRAVGIPDFAVGGSYSYLEDAELPEGLAKDDLLSTD